MQSSYILRQNNFDFEKTFKDCSEADNYKTQCYQSLGRDASGFTISNIAKTKEICLIGKNYEQQLGCFIGAAKDFKYYFHDDSEAKKLCEQYGVPLYLDTARFAQNAYFVADYQTGAIRFQRIGESA